MRHEARQVPSWLIFDVGQGVKPRTEARFAVGSRAGPRSSIWKAWVQNDSAYISTRMFGSDAKVSFHPTGDCHWSRTDTWVIRQTRPSNSARHIRRWQVRWPTDEKALMVFRVEIPVSEVRPVEAPRDRKKVFWLAGAPEGSTLRVVFYVTSVSHGDPAEGRQLPHRHLFSLRMPTGRWLIALCEVISLSATDLDAARTEVRSLLEKSGIVPDSSHTSSLFMEASESAPSGLLELCPISP